MLKFGAIDIDTSHPLGFSEYLSKGERGRYVAVYNNGFREKDEVEAFAKKNNLKICDTIEELCGLVDVAFVHSCNWDKHLESIKKVIKCKKTVFVDKPVVGNMKDLEEFLALSETDADIIGTSALRYCDEVCNLKKKLAEKNVCAMHTVVTVGVDEFNYAIHAVEMILEINKNTSPVSVRHLFDGEMNGLKTENYLIRFENGATAEYISIKGKFLMFNTTVITSDKAGNSDYCFVTDNKQFYRAMLDKVCDRMEGKCDELTTCRDMAESIKVMLAAKASRELNAGEVALDSDLLYKVKFDGYKFEQEYAAAASKMYL